MADNHAHDLERVTRYGNGFSRFRCRTPSCDYWTDARDDERSDELAHLRTEVARLLGNLDVCGEQRSHAEKREMALHGEVTRLTREINDRIDYDKKIAGERDALRAEVVQLTWNYNELKRTINLSVQEIVDERDALRAQLEAVTRERDETQVAWQALRACIVQLAGALRHLQARYHCDDARDALLAARAALAAAEKLGA